MCAARQRRGSTGNISTKERASCTGAGCGHGCGGDWGAVAPNGAPIERARLMLLLPAKVVVVLRGQALLRRERAPPAVPPLELVRHAEIDLEREKYIS